MKKPTRPSGFRKPPLPGSRPYGDLRQGGVRQGDRRLGHVLMSDLSPRLDNSDLRLQRARGLALQVSPLRAGLKNP